MNTTESISLDLEDTETPSIYERRRIDFYRIREKLQIIKDLNINDKLGYDEAGVLYIDKYEWGQYFRRVWYKQSRQKTEKFLDCEFTKLCQFLDKYLVFLEETPTFIVKILDPQYKILTNEICQFINDIIVGLYNLKKTYPDYKELKCRVDSIIMTLVDFKDKVKAKMILVASPHTFGRRALSF